MSLYERWTTLVNEERIPSLQNKFWNEYYEKEKEVYEKILAEDLQTIEGRADEIAKKFDIDVVWLAGFVDGINESIKNKVDLEALNEDSEIKMEISYEKLYFNMLEAKASWLYNLDEWDGIIDKDKRFQIKKDWQKSRMAVSTKIGRNDPCPCGSGKKYKKCCLK